MGIIYTQPTITGYNATPPPDDDSQTSANAVSWAKHISKIGDPIKTYAQAINNALVIAFGKIFNNNISTISTGYVLQASDRGKLLVTSGAITITLLESGTAGSGFTFSVRNSDTANGLTLDGNTSETINGATTIVIPPLSGAILTTDGSSWQALLTYPGLDETEGTAVASDATTDIWATDGNTLHITGTTGCTSFGTAPRIGAWRKLIYDDAVTLTNSANLHLQGEADYTTAAGDILFAYADTTTQIDVLIFPIGRPLHTRVQAEVGTGSGTTAGYTGIPSWVTMIVMTLKGVSTNGTSIPIIQIGDSGGYETTGYSGGGTNLPDAGAITSTNVTTGFALAGAWGAAGVVQGEVTLVRTDPTNHDWTAFGLLQTTNSAAALICVGNKTLTAALDRIQLTTTNGTDAFDNGNIGLYYS